jgi:hypothetical protein
VNRFGAGAVNDRYLASLAQVAVDTLTTGSFNDRRRVTDRIQHYADPGCTPDSLRKLARHIEGSFHTMPNGWVSADPQKGRIADE